jgi:hypothetical protein
MSDLSWNATRRAVYDRAKGYCEYCWTSEDNTGQAMEVEHIDPNGGGGLDNLCLSCGNCNRSKGIVTNAIDPQTGETVPFFNPRTQHWAEHFACEEGNLRIIGRSAIGQATLTRFQMNRARLVNARQRWIIAGFHPPKE